MLEDTGARAAGGVYQVFHYFFCKTCANAHYTRYVTDDKRVRVQMLNGCEGTDGESEEMWVLINGCIVSTRMYMERSSSRGP